MAVDGDTAQIGPELAGALEASCIADVRSLVRIDDASVAAWHATDEGTELVEADLPAVLTVSKDAAQLRMPSLAGVVSAERATCETRSAAEVAADPSRIGLAGSPTQVVRSFVPERAASAQVVEGSVDEQAARVAALIEEISRFRNEGGTEQSAERMEKAEQRFLLALEQQALIERILREAERFLCRRECSGPGASVCVPMSRSAWKTVHSSAVRTPSTTISNIPSPGSSIRIPCL